jgi:signal transduction histidine kinase
MNSIGVLLIDTKEDVKHLLERRFKQTQSLNFTINLLDANSATPTLQGNYEPWDVIIFGEQIKKSIVKELTKKMRSQGLTLPILMLSRISGECVPRTLRKIGVDDILNMAEIDSPVFMWTLMSILQQAELRKKADEFDVIRNRLQKINETLAYISHEINNPMSVIRLALYQLENRQLSKTRREWFFKLLTDSVSKVDEQMKELYTVRKQLGEDTGILTKILSGRTQQRAVA